MLLLLFSINILLALNEFFQSGMWVKGCRDFPHANQETNNSVESYHCFLKSKFLYDRRKKCARRMDWLLYQLLKNVEPYYRFRDILKEAGYLNNYKKEKVFESSMEKAKQIPDSDCWPHESISNGYWVRSQTNRDKKYLVTWYRMNIIGCDCPWSLRGNTCKHAIKVNWLYFSSCIRETSLEQNVEPDTFPEVSPNETNTLAEIDMETPIVDVDVNTVPVAVGSVDQDAEALKLARERVFGYMDVLKRSPPSTLANTLKLEALIKSMIDEANNQGIMDFDFTVGLSAYESSLKRKKSFLSPAKKRKRSKPNRGLEIDLNVRPFEQEPFQFPYSNRRGRPRSNNASPIVSSKLDWLMILIFLGYVLYPSPFLLVLVVHPTYIVPIRYI